MKEYTKFLKNFFTSIRSLCFLNEKINKSKLNSEIYEKKIFTTNFNKIKIKKIKAYVLIEASLSILLLGISLIIILSYSKYSLYKIRKIETRNKANYIRKALEGYVARHGMLPNAGNINGEGEEGRFEGYVPYKTLGISRMYQNNGFNKPFKFIVNPNFVLSEYKDCTVLPIFFPQDKFPEIVAFESRYKKTEDKKTEKRIVMFQRLYKKKYSLNEMQKTVEYIYLDEFKYQNLKEFELPSRNIILRTCYINNKKIKYLQKHIVQDCVVYALIANKSNFNSNFKSSKNCFWQSRFNLSSVLNHPNTNNVFNTSIMFTNQEYDLPIEGTTYKHTYESDEEVK